ncbi:MAG: hypothetical protein DI598_14185 [Pseudopedobacter saltans]|uniref:Uncharacterized protein n=1 Tax=Pseudopedobacter saltans TaxID=151895 RepID=A0A2W5EKQ8_9SPHI|nr:MAG: hypothetical protein DI598_14185 [Pseudopedobacter saltans]
MLANIIFEMHFSLYSILYYLQLGVYIDIMKMRFYWHGDIRFYSLSNDFLKWLLPYTIVAGGKTKFKQPGAK